nr:Thermonuclease [Cupriavidus sp.]
MRFSSRKLQRLVIVLALSLLGAVSVWTGPIDAGNPPATAATGYRLVKVFDGDSMLMRSPEGSVIQVRIAGIDAPEKSQPFADPARDRLAELLQQDGLRVAILKKDVYGRWLACLWIADQDLGLLMIEEGMVWFFRRYQSDLTKEQRLAYDAAEKSAQRAQRGLWQEADPVPPWEFRQQKREASRAEKQAR